MLLLVLSAGCTGPRLDQLDPGLPTHTAPPREAEPNEVARGWFLRARVAEERGDLEEAERAWKWALRLDRESAFLWSHRAQSLEQQRRWDEALEASEASWLIDPSLAQPRLVAARVALQQADDEAAEPHLRIALFDLQSAEAAVLLGRLYLRSGNATAAGETLDAWLALGELPPGQALARARLARELERSGDAVDDLATVLESPDAPTSAVRWLVAAADASCRAGTALSWAQRADGSNPDLAAGIVAVARLAEDPRLLDEAWPSAARTEAQRQELATLWRRAGRLDQALAVTVEPLDRARVLVDLGRGQDALALLTASDAPTRLARSLLVAELDSPEAARTGLADDAELLEDFEREWHRRSQPGQAIEAALATGDAEGALRIALSAEVELTAAEQSRLAPLLAASGPHDTELWVVAARAGVEPRQSATRALALDPCSGAARLLLVQGEGCATIPGLERTWDASPSLPEVRQRLLTAYDVCGTPANERLPVWELP